MTFQEIFCISADRKNYTMDKIDAMMILCPEIFLNEPEYLHFKIHILLDACKECENFKDISKKPYILRNVIPYNASCIVKLVLIWPVSSASNEGSLSRLKIFYNHLRTTMSDKKLDFLLILFSIRDIIDKINIQEIVNEWTSASENVSSTI